VAVNAQSSPLDHLWKEYGVIFQDFDDLTLARWMAQTLGQLQGRSWRLSHPLVGAYRLAAQVAHDRQIWFKRLANAPAAYSESECCRAPALPLLTRDVRDTGLICQHCSETLVRFEDLPEDIRADLAEWATDYEPVHAIAHWEEAQRQSCDYSAAFERAATQSEGLLLRLGTVIAPKLAEHYPAIIWEDQDECLEVRPEDVLA
jgi:hypothetical protein